MNPPALQPMLAKQVEQIPAASKAGGWLSEPTWDGYRAILCVDDDRGVSLISRLGRALKHAFPELVETLNMRRHLLPHRQLSKTIRGK